MFIVDVFREDTVVPVFIVRVAVELELTFILTPTPVVPCGAASTRARILVIVLSNGTYHLSVPGATDSVPGLL